MIPFPRLAGTRPNEMDSARKELCARKIQTTLAVQGRSHHLLRTECESHTSGCQPHDTTSESRLHGVCAQVRERVEGFISTGIGRKDLSRQKNHPTWNADNSLGVRWWWAKELRSPQRGHRILQETISALPPQTTLERQNHWTP